MAICFTLDQHGARSLKQQRLFQRFENDHFEHFPMKSYILQTTLLEWIS